MKGLTDFSLSWFDLLVVVVLLVGLFRGRKRGMSEELLDVIEWVLVVIACGMFYKPMGETLGALAHLNLLFSYLTCYLFLLVVIHFLFSAIRRAVGEKVVGSDIFGSLEYYLGMVAGMVRFACFLLIGMALLNAPFVSEERMRSNQKMQQENFGSISFPTFGSIQQEVFGHSQVGQLTRTYLGNVLIVPTSATSSAGSENLPSRRRERAIDEVIGK